MSRTVAALRAMRTVIMGGITLLAVHAPPLLAQGSQAPPASAPQTSIARGVVVQPESVTVGGPLRVVVRVRAPRGAVIEFPEAPDSALGIEALDPVVVVPSGDSSVTEQTATYRMAAWDVGRLPIRFADILVRQSGEVTRVPVGRELAVEVTSVLPADSAERIPQPPRALFVFGPPWWLWLLVVAAALGLLWAIWHWRRRRVAPQDPARTAYEAAQEEFARVASLDLIASGERGHFVALMTDVVRAYLARMFPAAPQALTTSELLQALRGEGRVPLARLSRVLHDADLVKFAGRAIDAERASEVGSESRAIVDAIEEALAPASQRDAA